MIGKSLRMPFPVAMIMAMGAFQVGGVESFGPVQTMPVAAAGNGVFADGSCLRFRRSEDFTPITTGPRRRLAKETMLYAEFQVKYGMYQNYLHNWIDRPLFYDRSLRPEKFAFETPESFAVHLREARRSGLDGFNFFAGKHGLPQILRFNSWLDDAGVCDMHILPTLGYGEDGHRDAVPEFIQQMIERALKDPRFPRIDGRPVIATYGHVMYTPDEHRKMLAFLEERLGKDSFIICGDLDNRVVTRLQRAYSDNGMLTNSEKNELEAAIRRVLDVAGGVQIRVDELKRPYDGQYCCVYDFSFFDNCTAPLLEKLLALPEYARKVVGFYVQQGYINHMSGNDNSEDCTGTLRRCLRSVARLNPDYLMFFEWNEVNENTMFQPTVWSGSTVGRILRWHSRLFKGLPSEPYPGDDTAIPPLTLTYRATAKPGEELRIEMLNIPDGVYAQKMRVRLELADVSGRMLAAFPEEAIEPSKFGAVTYLVDSLSLRGGSVLVPQLTVNGKVHRGFSPIRIDPTVSWNYKTVRQCLRGLMPPVKMEAMVNRVGSRSYAFDCRADFNEPLASMELICNEGEISAAGMQKEYDFVSNEVYRLSLSSAVGTSSYGTLAVSLPGIKGLRMLPQYTANINPGHPKRNSSGDGCSVPMLCWSARTSYFLLIPKSAPDDSTLEIVRTDAGGKRSASVPLSVLRAKGAAGAVLDKTKSSMRFDIVRVCELPDLPPHLNSPTVDWRGTADTDVRHPVFHFRAIGKSGRIWRSKPFRPDAIPDGDVKLPVYDEFAKVPSMASVPAAIVPEVEYDFDPAAGAVLVNSWESFFNAQLGGGFHYSEPFSDGRIKVEPGNRAPQWVKEDGRWCLAFDGVNDYVNFPKEAFPNAAFTVEMEVRPDCQSDRPMVLFRHFDFIRGSISLYINHGRLFAVWGDRDLRREPRIDTGLTVANGCWNAISVSYDLSEFVFRVGDGEYRYRWEGRPFRFKPSVFGGHDKYELVPAGGKKPVFYRGLLRKIVFSHHPETVRGK